MLHYLGNTAFIPSLIGDFCYQDAPYSDEPRNLCTFLGLSDWLAYQEHRITSCLRNKTKPDTPTFIDTSFFAYEHLMRQARRRDLVDDNEYETLWNKYETFMNKFCSDHYVSRFWLNRWDREDKPATVAALEENRRGPYTNSTLQEVIKTITPTAKLDTLCARPTEILLNHGDLVNSENDFDHLATQVAQSLDSFVNKYK
jgi:hypothetical protein